jgi:hypothetical protein
VHSFLINIAGNIFEGRAFSDVTMLQLCGLRDSFGERQL